VIEAVLILIMGLGRGVLRQGPSKG